MLYVDIPTLPEIRALIEKRADACVTIFLATTPQTQHVSASRTEFGNMRKAAVQQLTAAGFDKRRLALLDEELSGLQEDDEFWRFQANSLIVLATPDQVRTYRIATSISPGIQVSDRFHLKPLLRAMAFPQHAYVLALSENSVRLIEIFADSPPSIVPVPGLPASAADAVGRSSVNNLTQGTRISNSQGQTVLLRQYARRVDASLRPVLAGRDIPLILASTDPLGPIFRACNSYPALAAETIIGSPDQTPDHDLAQKARAILDGVYSAEVSAAKALYQARLGQRRATDELSGVARAATMGSIELVLFDIDAVELGVVDDVTGDVSSDQAPAAASYDIYDEIIGRAVLSGAKFLGVRNTDMPGGRPIAAILRYPL